MRKLFILLLVSALSSPAIADNVTVTPHVGPPQVAAQDSASIPLQDHGGETPLAFSMDTTSCGTFTVNVGYPAYCPSNEVFAGMKEGTLKTTTTTTTTYSWGSGTSCTAWPGGAGNCPSFSITASGWSCSMSGNSVDGVTTSCSGGSCPKATASGQQCETSSTQTTPGCSPDYCPKPTPATAAHVTYVTSTSTTTSKTTTTPVDDGSRTYYCCPQKTSY